VDTASESSRICPQLALLTEPIVTARVLVVVAHPDDETIGAGAILARSTDAHVAVVTDGAPNDRGFWPLALQEASPATYAQVRRDELVGALTEVGIGPDRVYWLAIKDGEAIDAVPAIVGRLVSLIRDIKPQVVLTHAYEGGHVDHDAVALAVHAAMALTDSGHAHEMALYHGSRGEITVHTFLPGPPAYTFHLDDRLQRRKSRMLARYETQQRYEQYFGLAVERYRCAPAHDFFSAPDADSPLLYERNHPAGTAERWRAQARLAVEELQVGDRMGNGRDRVARPRRDQITSADRMPLVSAIVRSAGRPTLGAALDSIAKQTYRNIEIVLVDVNGGGAPSGWQDRDGVVLRLCSAKGFDRSAAANAGLHAATGEYVGFLDDDDWFHPEHIESLVGALRASEARAAYGGVEVIEWPEDASPTRRWVFESAYDPIALICENYIPLNALLLERELVAEGCVFDETFTLYEDWDFLIQLSRRTTFHQVAGIGAVYRWPPGSRINDPSHAAAMQEQIFAKWQPRLSVGEHIAIIRRAIVQTELNGGYQSDLNALRDHVKAQDEELAVLRPCVQAQELQLKELRDHLAVLDLTIASLRSLLSAKEGEPSEPTSLPD
jgi:LmbE family N-acetylglucosaminyl deacetylase